MGGDKPDKKQVVAQLILILTRLSLSNAAELRAVTGAIWHTYLIDSSHPVAKAMTQTGKDYHEKTAQSPHNHGLGAPFLHMWCALLRALGADKRVQGEARDCLEAYWTQRVCKVPMGELELDVRHCRQKKAFKQGLCKINLMVSARACHNNNAYNDKSPMTLEEALITAMKQAEIEKKVGPPPAGALEREARTLLDKFGEDHKPKK